MENKIDFSQDIGTEAFNTEKEQELFSVRVACLSFISTRQEDSCSEEIVKYIKNNYYIYTTRDDLKSESWIYKDGIYTPNGISVIKELCRKVLESAYTPQRANKVLSKIEADTYIDVDEFVAHKNIWEMPVQNGILNLKTKEITSFTPDKIFFNKLPMEYNPEATCPAINNFFKSIMSEETGTDILYELLGYCLYRDHPIEKAFMFSGSGRNGKGKLNTLIKNFVGVKNAKAVSLEAMTPDNSAVWELSIALVNVAGDLDPTALKKTGLFKEITGRDVICAKRKYLRDLFFTNFSKQIFACNELPKVYDTSPGFWKRWVLLDFPNTFVTKKEYNAAKDKNCLKIADTEIVSKISTPDELSGLLNKAIIALNELLESGDFSYSKGTNEVKNTWIRKADSFKAFCMDNVKEDYDGFVLKRELRSRFSKYCRKHHIKSAGDKVIKMNLENDYGAFDSRKEVNGVWEHVFEGIVFNEDVEIKEIKEYKTLNKLREADGQLLEFDKKDYAELEELSAKGMVYSSNGLNGSLLWGLMD